MPDTEHQFRPTTWMSGDIVAATGNISSTTGTLSAGTTVTAGTGITSTTGNIAATAGAVSAGTDVSSGQHYLSTGTAPTAAAGANNGTSPPAPVVTSGDTDARGNITFGSGGTAAAGAQVVVTFATAYGAAPFVVVNPRNDATQQLGLYVSARTTTTFTLSSHSAPANSQGNTVYSFDYLVIG